MLRNISVFLPYMNRARSLATRIAKRKSKDPDESTEMKYNKYWKEVRTYIYPNFLARHLDTDFYKCARAFEKQPELSTLKQLNVAYSIKALKSLNFTPEEICSNPMILFVSGSTIQNRYCILEECGVESVTFAKLLKYITIMNKKISELKLQQILPCDVDVFERLRSSFKDINIELEAPQQAEEMKLKRMRDIVITAYIKQRFKLSDTDIEKIWRSYSRLRQKSFHTMQRSVKVLLEEFKFTEERIAKNAFLLYADDENIKRILREIPTIGGQDIRDVGYRRPKILMSSCDALLTTLQHVKSFGINEEAVTRCLEVLTLGPDTVLERLKDLNEIEEFQVLTSNPRVLRLVHYQNKARLRLEYLNQIKVRCASLHILSCGSEAFTRFARDGSDRTKGRDVVVYLSNIMQKDINDLRNILSRHPHWCHVPSTHVKQVYEFLLNKNFSCDEIYQNIHLLLYPIKRIEEKLSTLYNKGISDIDEQIDINTNAMSNSEILTLVLYLIEIEFHFTGDGIWTEQHTHQLENFKNLLPDFPETSTKVYKYGVKPALKQEQQINQT